MVKTKLEQEKQGWRQWYKEDAGGKIHWEEIKGRTQEDGRIKRIQSDEQEEKDLRT